MARTFIEDKVHFSVSTATHQESVDNVIELDTYKTYSFKSDFLTPVDSFSFTVGDSDITEKFRRIVVPGAEVILRINDRKQAHGYVDSVTVTSSRGGTEFQVSGRNTLKYAADSSIDPRTTFQATQSLEDVLKQVFAPFGWADAGDFVIDNEANKALMTGSHRGERSPNQKVHLTDKNKPLKSYALHLTKPYPREGAFQFASRLSQRHGLWIWASADGENIIVGKPDYTTFVKGALAHIPGDDACNILSASVTRDDHDLPSVIIASGVGVGGASPRDQFTRGMMNPLLIGGEGEIGGPFYGLKKIQESWPNTTFVDYLDQPGASFQDNQKVFNSFSRPMFLHDDESKTQEQLENFIRREMALRLRKSFTYHCEVEGHGFDGVPWCIDTMVRVKDDVLGVDENLWVQSRTFTKSRHGGTKTSLELIRPYTIVF